MLKRRRIRELAMQTLFTWDSQQEASEDVVSVVAEGDPDLRAGRGEPDDPDVTRTAAEMAKGTWEQRVIIDPWIERLAPQWPLRRQPAVDRNLLRLAIWELTNTPTPPKVVIDEAIELAKQYSTEQSAAFVNGVLDTVLKEQQKLTQSSS